jgi:phage repressor protein C with HTH and peptisase S24 domain
MKRPTPANKPVEVDRVQNRSAAANKPAEFNLLQLALPGEAPLNIGILLLDVKNGGLYKKLRRDWSIAGREHREILESLDEDFDSKISEMGGKAFLASLTDTLSNFLLITDPVEVTVSDFETALNRLFEEHVQRTEVIPFVTHVPLYSLRAAATKFGENMEVEAAGWAKAPDRVKLDRHMFAARVVGRSMEPLIPDGSLCLFHAGVTGSRQGRRLLIQQLGVSDTSAEYTVKRYTSQKVQTGEDQWGHLSITLMPLNPEFEPMVFTPDDEHRRFRVIAEFVQVLKEPV